MNLILILNFWRGLFNVKTTLKKSLSAIKSKPDLRQLKIGIDPFYQARLFETFSNRHNLHMCYYRRFFDMH